jgi:beta-glucanase (GH16 family)
MKLVFSEDFDRLSVSPWGPGTTWIAHTPWNGDFGDAAFSDPAPDFPFSVKQGVLRIEARQGPDRKWRSGLLASADPKGQGTSRQYGYFELRAKLPRGPGLWPAFWLASVAKDDAEASVEIDVLEHYGHSPGTYQSVVHTWYKDGRHNAVTHVHEVEPGSLYDDFHTYGTMVGSESIAFYMDRVEIWRVPTPKEHERSLLILLNLALGSGWPIDQTPNPSVMEVDYVRIFAAGDGRGIQDRGLRPGASAQALHRSTWSPQRSINCSQ